MTLYNQLTELNIWDKALPSDRYLSVVDVLDATKSSSLVLGKCELSIEKLSFLGQHCEEKGCKVLILRSKSFSIFYHSTRFRSSASTIICHIATASSAFLSSNIKQSSTRITRYMTWHVPYAQTTHRTEHRTRLWQSKTPYATPCWCCIFRLTGQNFGQGLMYQ